MEEATTEKKKGRFVVKNVKADDDDVANVRSTPQVTELATAATEVVPAEDPKAAPPKKSRFTVKTLTAEQDASTQHHEALRQQFHGSTSYSQMELLQRMEQLLEMNMQILHRAMLEASKGKQPPRTELVESSGAGHASDVSDGPTSAHIDNASGAIAIESLSEHAGGQPSPRPTSQKQSRPADPEGGVNGVSSSRNSSSSSSSSSSSLEDDDSNRGDDTIAGAATKAPPSSTRHQTYPSVPALQGTNVAPPPLSRAAHGPVDEAIHAAQSAPMQTPIQTTSASAQQPNSGGQTSSFVIAAPHASSITTTTSILPIGTDKDKSFAKLSHYLGEMKRELDATQKQRREMQLETTRLREKCQQLEDLLFAEQSKSSALEERLKSAKNAQKQQQAVIDAQQAKLDEQRTLIESFDLQLRQIAAAPKTIVEEQQASKSPESQQMEQTTEGQSEMTSLELLAPLPSAQQHPAQSLQQFQSHPLVEKGIPRTATPPIQDKLLSAESLQQQSQEHQKRVVLPQNQKVSVEQPQPQPPSTLERGAFSKQPSGSWEDFTIATMNGLPTARSMEMDDMVARSQGMPCRDESVVTGSSEMKDHPQHSPLAFNPCLPLPSNRTVTTAPFLSKEVVAMNGVPLQAALSHAQVTSTLPGMTISSVPSPMLPHQLQQSHQQPFPTAIDELDSIAARSERTKGPPQGIFS